ncbi:DUF4124 domain-containing protein [Ectopseudomonas toyotomiensis]|uniref:DUF4124 domain-containing protein n=1 Tax=Ectopseudomonas toyotomiensis TaxID=554344 RepID=A0A1I5UNB7_9GAMM|nr:DUF4124 domain-containing protein [Pseudomonas toyotomiensis]MCW1936631.1 DUF4124 domain-containing protein [Pseudomonas sp. MDMC_285]PIA73292.1 DUF4124 domain-containing protein [Pseudomonas toyotomiensis]SFP96709.1 protein of unknown function [Pseudomonas toyotomiensis]
MLCRKLLPLLLLCAATTAQAQIYQWVDEKGQKHFSTQPPVAQPNVEPVKINQGYVGDDRPATQTEAASSESKPTASAQSSKKEMCSSAMRWTAIDIDNLKGIAREKKQSGQASAAEYDKGIKGLDDVNKQITMQDCITSSGEDQKNYECLSKGAGILVCSGLMAEAFKEAFKEGAKRAQKP